jgi:cation diffusion facilitator family transporter
MKHLRAPVIFSIVAAISTLALKAVSWLLTDSIGLLSDALESGINLLAALTAYIALWYASRPADLGHTYGHEKIEFFSSGLEGGLILIAAIGIIRTAIMRLIQPVPLESIGIGTLISFVAALINLAVAQWLLRVGKRHGSIILEADGHHLMTDVWTSVGVIVALGLVAWTKWLWLDPVIAILVAANIAFTGVSLVRRSFHGLMDAALSDDDLAKLRAAIQAQLPAGTTYHALRTRRGGTRKFADFHLLVPGSWSVQQAHDLSDAIENAVKQSLPGIELTLHFEPIESPASWHDSELLGVEPEVRVPESKVNEERP